MKEEIPVLVFLFLSSIMRCQSQSDPKAILTAMTRQAMMQQFFTEESIRNSGSSGIKQVRLYNSGTKNYHAETHNGYMIGSVHDHTNNRLTSGFGEIAAVLNGVEFRTRHNDYDLVIPSRSSSDWHKTETIKFPDVPPEVLAQSSLDGQIKELREWFKAWRNQDFSKRDYRKYFKPVLCYLEGAWTITGKEVDEPFFSPRHFIDAKTWDELHEKNRFQGYSGGKSRFENLAVLPPGIMGINGSGQAIPVQFNYRILCHPLKDDLPTDRLILAEDFSTRLFAGKSMHFHRMTTAARFKVSGEDGPQVEKKYKGHGLLDALMEQVPGKNNYIGKFESDPKDKTQIFHAKEDRLLNQGRYHRWYRVKKNGKIENKLIHRSFNDDHLFVARTDHKHVVKMKINGKFERWTWAMPMEIIYVTPLHNWNPYDIKLVPWEKRDLVTKDGRNGDCKDMDPKKAYDGVNDVTFYRTPFEFFAGLNEVKGNLADTTVSQVCVLDKTGKVRKTKASGISIRMPEIKSVGVLRTRYPIPPIHSEGSGAWKEVNALRELVMDPEKMKRYITPDEHLAAVRQTTLTLEPVPGGDGHSHTVTLSQQDVREALGERVLVFSDTQQKHSHVLEIIAKITKGRVEYEYVLCDGRKECVHKHPKVLSIVKPKK